MIRLLQYIPFICLFLSIIFLWLPKHRNNWLYLFIAGFSSAFIFAVIDFMPLFLGGLLYASIYFYYDKEYNVKALPASALLILGLLFLSHSVPGVHNLILASNIQFASSTHFNLYFNFDKTVLGLLIFAISGVQLVSSWEEYKKLVLNIKYELLILTIILSILALISGFIKISFKFPSCTFSWLVHNLFTTAIAEEGFFRIFIQVGLMSFLGSHITENSAIAKFLSASLRIFKLDETKIKALYPNILAAIPAIFITALFFGICHYQGGISFILLSFIAGVFYGWVYLKTSRIEAAITTHFLVNTVHFFCFTYPQYLID